jgi:hypothetical protein
MSILELLIQREKITGDCWLWARYIGYGGYGGMHGNKKAHRVIYEALVGEIPEGMFVLHKCDTPRCINPDHLFLGTALDNARDRDTKGRDRWSRATPYLARTHCKRGHAYTADNLYKNKRGWNICKACHRRNYEEHKV